MTTPAPGRWYGRLWNGAVSSASVPKPPTRTPRCRAAKEWQPDVCLLDINMPGSGIAAAARITAALPDTAVVMLTVSRQDEDLFDALRAGASGYLLKGMDENAIGDALHRVLAGESPLPGSLVARLVEEFRDREHRRVAVPDAQAARLTGREWDVLELMRKGCQHVGDLAPPVHFTDDGPQPRLGHLAQARGDPTGRRPSPCSSRSSPEG